MILSEKKEKLKKFKKIWADSMNFDPINKVGGLFGRNINIFSADLMISDLINKVKRSFWKYKI